ncbi:MAG: hypothetical protein COZ70_15455 [Deltaproteobacteria bacterium CG_4_8_14_3_um_filter_51_11]|nr:DUF1090 domain-containing protein [bacterium]OIP41375.1 MAG: hypothetical protein AUK25_05840 [Desulfobacteraceae bacterium CG2_30_51_40]PIP47334.1 MAG: hypothetical protein COX16_04875 [Deltaproteobacteria bacterium CG23_combo_of_CG06-09_8_20_14_all_51_20]PIW00742.1 MAG: hypothetical protein COW41_04640 [Deltaproteobacteria bacterium CG17_big_fil_post_rev_8_21_14_2_50_51_6]PIX18208.1 MAG: hypothetical protein COZ70_15455 [Deltaproteobacteria bacterium CG_4_8_14_3_um_filter_51_11]PIY22141.1
MKIPEYVTAEEVKRICSELNIRDWSSLEDTHVLPEEARLILSEINTEGMNIPLDDFCEGLEVELEHGTMFKFSNVTNNHPLLTGRIVLAHFQESMDYYKRLSVAELEGDLVKAIRSKDQQKIHAVYKKLAKARTQLYQAELEHLS